MPDPAAKTSAADLPNWGQRGTAPAIIASRLTFEAVVHDYDGVPSLKGVSLDVAPGEIVCLLGHSGCGKTTLLRIVAGLEQPSSGRVSIDGMEMAGPNRFVPPERRGVGLMFQDYALFPHMTILANVMFGLTSLDRAAAERAARAALGRVGLESHADDYPHALSGGEQQRVALARAIVPRPSILLMDEPFSGLDRRLRDNVRDETIAVLRETRATALVVTHDPEEAMRMADRIALMRGGALVQIGTAEDLYARPVDLFAARFFSEVNVIEGVVRGGMVETPIGRFPAERFAEGAAVDVCVRLPGVLLGPPGAGAEGRVIRQRFLGEVSLVEVVVEGLDRPLKARLRAMSEPFSVGADISVDTDPRDVLVFPR
ncbi:ABC transporter ATP-binding protein [Chthonobacter rhizosphaerae]|uniref:ABC transporter ATP-binding protein n=1 Tax=Chthonobacter rhizosphaerae TaxID=2735553 RepID=UPI0015EE55A9|nr:ABC transporter ATP-binding protein [Chthonobacter rhizosphaerae]